MSESTVSFKYLLQWLPVKDLAWNDCTSILCHFSALSSLMAVGPDLYLSEPSSSLVSVFVDFLFFLRRHLTCFPKCVDLSISGSSSWRVSNFFVQFVAFFLQQRMMFLFFVIPRTMCIHRGQIRSSSIRNTGHLMTLWYFAAFFFFFFFFVLSVSFECRIVPFYASSLSVQYMWLYFVGRLHLWFGGITPQAWVGAYCTWKSRDIAQEVKIPKHVQLYCFSFPCQVA